MELQFDPEEATAALRQADCRLAAIIRQAGPFTWRPKPSQRPFEALIMSIIHQQLSGIAAASIHRRVRALYAPREGLRPEDVLETPDEDLRGAGLSRAKVASIKDLARKALDGTVPSLARLRSMGDEAIIQRLVQVRGVGRWTVEMLLIFRLGRSDVLPATDLGVRKGFKATYHLAELPAPAEILAHGEKWRPWRSVASWYLWRAAEMGG